MTSPAQQVVLPRRPRLLPGLEVLSRRRDELQIGLDPRHAVVATDLPPVLVDLLRGLDGRRSTEALFELASGEHAERLRSVLADLVRHGLVEDGAGTPGPEYDRPVLWSTAPGRLGHREPVRPAPRHVLVHGSGRLAAAVTASLAASGIGHLGARADGVVGPADLGSGFVAEDIGRARSEALRTVARRACPEVRTGPLAHGRTSDLVLLTDAVVPAPEVVGTLVAEGTAHLPVRVRDGIGIVGPLVVPGRSSCLRCADLHRTALDPCWPTVAGQLAGRSQRADLTTAYGTAALAAGQVLRALAPVSGPEPPPSWNATLELDCYAGAVRRRHWPPHPHCQCGARHAPSRR